MDGWMDGLAGVRKNDEWRVARGEVARVAKWRVHDLHHSGKCFVCLCRGTLISATEYFPELVCLFVCFSSDRVFHRYFTIVHLFATRPLDGVRSGWPSSGFLRVVPRGGSGPRQDFFGKGWVFFFSLTYYESG